MHALGLNDDVTHPVERESFAEVVQHTLTTHAQPLFTRMLREGSALFDTDLVDPDALRQAVLYVRDGHYHEHNDAQLLEVIDFHLAAAAFL
ncbi:hypothetical protein [Frankia sp. Cppng1_Ct_nod]|uniref:hypothetical protein n=1 Tax=Frankia sp. Cppng1_Ct_nod TaxID=2897162 RepID=UPI001A952565|nr:hypothetical protein [Frankia sp. Cppng1_Ct_nod]